MYYKLLILGLLGFCSCTKETKIQDSAFRQDLYNAANSSVLSSSACVISEGDYETKNYCVSITKNNTDDLGKEFNMKIRSKKTSQSVTYLAKYWYTFNTKTNEGVTYGYQTTEGDKTYEIDWSNKTTYFRIWDKKNQHKLVEETVIKTPKDLFDEAEKTIGKANLDKDEVASE